ncbi:MAG: hypothetical protein JO182_16060 [Acidobacteriaceae bacterium]|nr:hypothetical protein [Acidobacteriaceae bacterium]MBV9225140.1 hypothetical protein [Acidobacteriaceae bacterium]MBV9680088.1 hypothetical protein [Acidobacteriaceae bacterium]MBV9937660.1 hypothetical protein [Acidobacteriaceae bacterium]
MAPNHKLTNVIKGRKIQAIQQSDVDLIIQFEDGSTMHVKLAEPTSSVMVRDTQNKMEYAD